MEIIHTSRFVTNREGLKLSYIQIFPFRGNMAFQPCFVKANGYIF